MDVFVRERTVASKYGVLYCFCIYFGVVFCAVGECKFDFSCSALEAHRGESAVWEVVAPVLILAV
jgi:hypothetical protein